MADMASALSNRLLADPDVAGFVGTLVKWVKVPQDAPLPYLRLQVISDPLTQHLKGYDGMQVVRVQADCFGATHLQSRALAKAVIEAVAARAEVDGVRFGRTKAEGPRDLGEDVAGKCFIHRASMDLLVSYRLI